jgi:hypothetical protein
MYRQEAEQILNDRISCSTVALSKEVRLLFANSRLEILPGDLRNAFLQVLSKKGTSNVSVVKFLVVDTNGHARNPVHLNALAFNYPFVGCFI